MRAPLVSLTALLLTASTALAQTTAQTPSPAPDATTGGIGDYWWLIVVVVLVALAIWYFTRGRTRL
jgi:LPXTG-motif cell wall-anchored protein